MTNKYEKIATQEALLKLSKLALLPDSFKIIKSGCYCYFLNNEKTTIIEPWIIAVNDDDQTLIQSARFVEDHQITLLVEHLTYGNSATEHLSKSNCDAQASGEIYLSASFDSAVSWLSQGELVKYCRFQYQIGQDTLTWTDMTKESSTRQQFKLPSDGKFQFFPLMRVFTGNVLQALAKYGDHNIIVPDIRTSHIQSSLFCPYMSTRAANFLAADITSIAGKEVKCQQYSYLSDIYHAEDNAKFWLNKNYLLAKYQWQQSPELFWQVELYLVNNTQ